MKLKVQVKIPDRLGYEIRSRINKVILDESFRKDIGREIVEDIQRNARRGFGIKDNLLRVAQLRIEII